jgi:citrate/tricarballylate utilization protein
LAPDDWIRDPIADHLTDARRDMEICNACRYCEGYCAVFPAMEARRAFTDGDLAYLANLCHGCRACFYACQYAPPHEFGINIPRTFAEIRAHTYEDYAWPKPLAGLFQRNGTVVTLATAAILALSLILIMLVQNPETVFGAHSGPGAFYKVIPWGVMAGIAGASFLFSLLALAMGFVNFWRDTKAPAASGVKAKPLAQAIHDALTLRNLGGGGHGCNDRDPSFSTGRRRFHHFMFYGFMLCFASTVVASFYDYFLGMHAPYPFWSPPVLLGTLGGIGMVIGTSGLLWLKLVGDQEPTARRLLGADVALLALLWLIAATGLVLLAFRDSPAMGILLVVHLAFVLTLFVLLPYCKFVHGIYRFGALLRNAMEGTRDSV